MPAFKPPGQCPNCGEWVPRGQKACDSCGACDKTAWKADTEVYDGLDLPDDPDDFNYDEFIQREFGAPAKRTGGIRWNKEIFVRVVAAILLAAMLAGILVRVLQ